MLTNSDTHAIIWEEADVGLLPDDGWEDTFKLLPPKPLILFETTNELDTSASSPDSKRNSLKLARRSQSERLFRAVEAGRLDSFLGVLSLTLESQQIALLNKTTLDGWNCLHLASYYGHSNIVRYLVDRRVRVNLETTEHWTALQLASYIGHLACVRGLLEHPNLQLNKKTVTNGTGLHLAAKRSHFEIVKALLEAGASMYIEDEAGHIALELATKQEILELIPVYMGRKWLAKNTELSQPPPVYANNVYLSRRFRLKDSYVHLVLHPSLGVLSRFASEENHRKGRTAEHSIELFNLTSTQFMPRGMFQNKRFFSFIVESANETTRYYTLSEAHSMEWVERINQAIEYCRIIKHSLPDTTKQIQAVVTTDPETSVQEPIQENKPAITLKSFKIIDDIGCGSFAKVYKVEKIDDGCVFAMKSLNKNFLRKRRQLKYAVIEGQILQQLEHPFIIKLHYTIQSTKNLYFFLDFCSNGDLAMQLADHGPFSEEESKFFVIELILVLEYLHGLDIVYRDLKPSNILLDSNGHVKLTDFGLAKNSNVDVPASFVGSPAYLAPEMLTDKISSKAGDVYTLGLIFFELLSGKPPYYDTDISVLFENIRRAQLKYPPDISPEVSNFIRALINPMPSRRPSIQECKNHPLFIQTDWTAYLQKRVKSPAKLRDCASETE